MGNTSRRQLLGSLVAAAGAASLVASAPLAAPGTHLSVTCSGTATVRTATGAGSATATCHGSLAGTLKGSGSGTEAPPCIDYSGHASITGTAASIAFKTAPDQHVCFTAAPKTVLAVSGEVEVTDGSGAFADANGTLGFRARYNRESGALTVTFSGTVG